MKSAAAPALTSDNVINTGVCADRILAIVRRLQEQVKDQEQAVAEAKETTRKEVTNTLLNRFDLEISRLQAQFDRRLRDVADENEALEELKIQSAVAAARDGIQEQARKEYQSKLTETEKLIDRLKEDARTQANEWRAEKEQLQQRIALLERTVDTATATRTEKLDDRKELERKLEEALQAKEQLQADLQRAVAELNSQTQAGTKDEPDQAAHREVAAIVQSEMVRVRLHLDEIEKTHADPATELGIKMRLVRERSELEAYLKGLRYSLGEVTLEASGVQDSCSV